MIAGAVFFAPQNDKRTQTHFYMPVDCVHRSTNIRPKKTSPNKASVRMQAKSAKTIWLIKKLNSIQVEQQKKND